MSPPEWLEKAGLWSYSLYLLHPAASIKFLSYFPTARESFHWLIYLAFVLIFSYLFYLIIEAPSHRLARKAGLLSGLTIELKKEDPAFLTPGK
jgi:peptidoglycan/LPS O-acetylase OafA/YrhL